MRSAAWHSSIDAVRTSIGYATQQAGAALGRTIDLVDSANRALALPSLPGGSVVAGATDAARLVIEGALESSAAIVDGAAEGADARVRVRVRVRARALRMVPAPRERAPLADARARARARAAQAPSTSRSRCRQARRAACSAVYAVEPSSCAAASTRARARLAKQRRAAPRYSRQALTVQLDTWDLLGWP